MAASQALYRCMAWQFFLAVIAEDAACGRVHGLGCALGRAIASFVERCVLAAICYLKE